MDPSSIPWSVTFFYVSCWGATGHWVSPADEQSVTQYVRRIRDSSAIAMTAFESVAAWKVVEERRCDFIVFFSCDYQGTELQSILTEFHEENTLTITSSCSSRSVLFTVTRICLLVVYGNILVGVVGVVIKMSFFSLQVFWKVIYSDFFLNDDFV
jgi:hypothetical protein